jgi:hypothetical protein
MKRFASVVCLAAISLVAGACVNPGSVALTAFSDKFGCPESQTAIAPVVANPTGSQYDMTGCGRQTRYVCTREMSMYGDRFSCRENTKSSIIATTGAEYTFWDNDFVQMKAAADKAAIASAAHDLPCAQASIKVVGTGVNDFPNILDGCGQRVTYQFKVGGETGDKMPYLLSGRMPAPQP